MCFFCVKFRAKMGKNNSFLALNNLHLFKNAIITFLQNSGTMIFATDLRIQNPFSSNKNYVLILILTPFYSNFIVKLMKWIILHQNQNFTNNFTLNKECNSTTKVFGTFSCPPGNLNLEKCSFYCIFCLNLI